MTDERKSREQVVSIFKTVDKDVAETGCFRFGPNAEAPSMPWHSPLSDRELADATRLRELEQENMQLKRLLADAELDKAALKDLLETIA
jgi:putative transposase